jgi:hypothetical protein
MIAYGMPLRVVKPDHFVTTGFWNAEVLLAVTPTALLLLNPCAQRRHLVAAVLGAVLWLFVVWSLITDAFCPNDYLIVDFVSLSTLWACNGFTSTHKCPNRPHSLYIASAIAVLMHGVAGASTATVIVIVACRRVLLLCVFVPLPVVLCVLHFYVEDMILAHGTYHTHHWLMLSVLGFCLVSLIVGRWWKVLARLG